jgi:hypothetical protein
MIPELRILIASYHLFVASAPRPAPNLPATGKYVLKIKATDEP